jgi:hypothetical protein
MAICIYLFASLGQGLCEMRPTRFDTLCIDLFFLLLYLAGAFSSFYLLTGAKWACVFVSTMALLTATARLMGLFAWFNSSPFSLVGIVFDVFALASAGVLLSSRRYAPA